MRRERGTARGRKENERRKEAEEVSKGEQGSIYWEALRYKAWVERMGSPKKQN